MGTKLNFKGGLVKYSYSNDLYLKFQDKELSFYCYIKDSDGRRCKGYFDERSHRKIVEGELTSW